MKFTMQDHNTFLQYAADPRATEEERETLSFAAAMAAANERVSKDLYLRAQALVGAALSTTTPIFDRPSDE